MIFDEYLIKSRISRQPRSDGNPGCDTRGVVANPKAFRMAIDALAQNFIESPVTHIASIESRGFLFAAPLAYTLGLPLVLIRKRNDQSGDLEEPLGSQHSLYLAEDELGSDARVLLFDDAVVSGQTLCAASTLIHRAGATVTETATLVTLSGAGGIQLLDRMEMSLYSLVSFDAGAA
ncbi:phosphoribosyltransferase family protein [Marinobacteraceae bacterium S3BR75-40.1]